MSAGCASSRRLQGENLFPCLFQLLEFAAHMVGGPFLLLRGPNVASSNLFLSLSCFSLSLRGTFVIILSPPAQSKIISPSQEPHFSHMCKVSLPCQVTHTQVLGTGCGHLWGAVIASLGVLVQTAWIFHTLLGSRDQHTGGDIRPGGDESGEE